jgi:hypothetical protein
MRERVSRLPFVPRSKHPDSGAKGLWGEESVALRGATRSQRTIAIEVRPTLAFFPVRRLAAAKGYGRNRVSVPIIGAKGP